MIEYNYIIEIILWCNILLLLNIFILYPVFLTIFAKIFKKPLIFNENFNPDITIIISAFNEEKLIKDAILSIYKSDYPLEKIKVIVGSDGSDDNTIAILKELKELYKSLDYYDFKRSGKNKILNELVKKSQTDIIFFMDADLRLLENTLTRMVLVLSDNNVGSVLASLNILGDENVKSAGGAGESLYQKYEKIMRRNESKIKSNINSLGTVYGIKKEFYKPIPNDLVCDDLFNMLSIAISGKRIIFDESAVVTEVREKTTKAEVFRRIRLVAGGLSTVASCKTILHPKFGWVSYFVWNHKLLRWLSPVYLMILLLGSFIISKSSILYSILIILQSALYSGALIGWIFEKLKFNWNPFRIFLFIVSMNIGFFMGILRFLSKGQNALWGRQVSN